MLVEDYFLMLKVYLLAVTHTLRQGKASSMPDEE
jgi:hypothetical protein